MGDPNELLGAIEDYVARAVAPLVKRVQQLEAERARIPERGEKGEPGIDGEDGRVDYMAIEGTLAAMVEKELAKRPAAKDGAPGRDAVPVDYAHIGDMVKAAAITAIAELPKPKDGERGEPGKDGSPGAAGKDGERGEPGKDGSPGAAGKDADEAAIIAKVLAAIPVPKDGVDGAPGKDADIAPAIHNLELRFVALKGDLENQIKAIPLPQDGKDGRDGQRGPPGEGLRGEPGRDALDGLASIECALRGERTLALDFLMLGGARKSFEFRLPVPIYRGIHKDGVRYEQGDGVTRDGSTWIAAKDTDTTPPSADWTLAVKKGRDLR